MEDEIRYTKFGDIIHKLKNTIDDNRPYFWLSEWLFKNYSLEKELTMLGLQVEYPDEEEIEKRESDSKDMDVKVIADGKRINLDHLKAFLFPLEKWDSNGKCQAVHNLLLSVTYFALLKELVFYSE
jgi:hypothetical protein